MPSQRPRRQLMNSCPPDEQLTGLLTEALSTAERDAVARHVEGCAACQEALAQLTAIPTAAMGQRPEPAPHGSQAEEDAVRRLKEMTPPLAPFKLEEAATAGGDSPPAGDPLPATAGSDPPTVPGYETVGALGRGGNGGVSQARH